MIISILLILYEEFEEFRVSWRDHIGSAIWGWDSIKMGYFCVVCGSKYLFTCLRSRAREIQLWLRIWELCPTIEPKKWIFFDNLFPTMSNLRPLCPTYDLKTRHFSLYWATANYNYELSKDIWVVIFMLFVPHQIVLFVSRYHPNMSTRRRIGWWRVIMKARVYDSRNERMDLKMI